MKKLRKEIEEKMKFHILNLNLNISLKFFWKKWIYLKIGTKNNIQKEWEMIYYHTYKDLVRSGKIMQKFEFFFNTIKNTSWMFNKNKIKKWRRSNTLHESE